MGKRLNYDFLDCARKMPSLSHGFSGFEFDVKKSEVCHWLIMQPEVMQKIFNMAMNHGVIVFNRDTGKWQGVDHDD